MFAVDVFFFFYFIHFSSLLSETLQFASASMKICQRKQVRLKVEGILERSMNPTKPKLYCNIVWCFCVLCVSRVTLLESNKDSILQQLATQTQTQIFPGFELPKGLLFCRFNRLHREKEGYSHFSKSADGVCGRQVVCSSVLSGLGKRSSFRFWVYFFSSFICHGHRCTKSC